MRWIFGWRTRNAELVFVWFSTPNHIAELSVSTTHGRRFRLHLVVGVDTVIRDGFADVD